MIYLAYDTLHPYYVKKNNSTIKFLCYDTLLNQEQAMRGDYPSKEGRLSGKENAQFL